MNNKKTKLIVAIAIVILIILGIFGFYLYSKHQNDNNIPNNYIAVFHGGEGEYTYETYI